MMTLRLPENMDKRLSQLAKETHRSKSYYVKQAIEEFLEEREDYLLALAAMERFERGEEKAVSFEEILKKYGLENDKH